MCGENGSIRDLNYVLWEVSMSVTKQLVHVKLRARNVWTVEPPKPLAPIAQKAFFALDQSQQKIQW